MTDRPPYMPFYVKDYIAKTSHLTFAEHGAYICLLNLQWTTAEGTMPNDPDWIRRRLRATTEEFENVISPILEEYFSVKGNRILNQKCKDIFDETSGKILAKSKAGKSGALAKHKKNNEKTSGNRTILPEAKSYERSVLPETELSDRKDLPQAKTYGRRDLLKQPEPEPEPEPEYTEANASGENAPADDLKDKIWRDGVAFLTSKSVRDSQARSIIGKWLKDFSPEQVDNALKQADESKTGNPIPYINKILLGSKAQNNPDFERFWSAYPDGPNKVDRDQAARVFADVLKGDDPPTVDALVAAAAKVTADDPKFIPSPRRWLEGRRWQASAGAEVYPFAGHKVLGDLPVSDTLYAAADAYFQNHEDERENWREAMADLFARRK